MDIYMTFLKFLYIQLTFYSFYKPNLGDFAKERKATFILIISVCSLVRPSQWDKSALAGQFFIKFYF